MDATLQTIHLLTLRSLASAEQLAQISGGNASQITESLDKAVANGQVVAAKGNFMVSPVGRAALDEAYPVAFAQFRESPEVAAAMDNFETGVNKQILALTTQWQTREVDGEPVANDHSDPGYDEAIIGKIARVHEKTGAVLQPIADRDPMIERFLDRIGTALTKAEGGDTDYISGVRVDSVHTVWFQMHEHLLRLSGRERPE